MPQLPCYLGLRGTGVGRAGVVVTNQGKRRDWRAFA